MYSPVSVFEAEIVRQNIKEQAQLFTTFIRISAQPWISNHLENAPTLKAEKGKERPSSNMHPSPPQPPLTQSQISAHRHIIRTTFTLTIIINQLMTPGFQPFTRINVFFKEVEKFQYCQKENKL